MTKDRNVTIKQYIKDLEEIFQANYKKYADNKNDE